jgi:hypothetical protein
MERWKEGMKRHLLRDAMTRGRQASSPMICLADHCASPSLHLSLLTRITHAQTFHRPPARGPLASLCFSEQTTRPAKQATRQAPSSFLLLASSPLSSLLPASSCCKPRPTTPSTPNNMALLSVLLRLGGFILSLFFYSYFELLDLSSAVGGAEGGLDRLWAAGAGAGVLPPPSVMK